ncbi:TPA: DUF551 domain-containing protein [Enterobacter ludwigii]
MAKITKEWLQQKIADMEATRDEIPFGLDEDDSNTLAALRIALASLEEEPAIHRWRRVTSEPYGPYPWHYGDFIGFSKPVDGIEDEYYYSAPPAPVVPPEKNDSDYVTDCHGVPSLEDCAHQRGWNECRAAMLQSFGNSEQLEPVMTAYKLPAIGWLRADYQDDNRGLRGNAPLFVLGKKNPSSLWGLDYIPLTAKSPVIPDGWVACSERMPEENAEQEVLACFKGGDISTLYYFEGRWDDAYGIVPIRQDVTYWMPLPAAPQQEVK